MNSSQLMRMFTQSVVWSEIIEATTSLNAENVSNHTLGNVRISMQADGRTTSSDGEQSSCSCTLYYLINYSTSDGSAIVPGFSVGDEITTVTGRVMTVERVRTLYGVSGTPHHLEVALK